MRSKVCRSAASSSGAFAWPSARPPRGGDVLSCRYQRVVARDNTVRLGPRVVQLARAPLGRCYVGRRLEVRELLDGRLAVLDGPTVIASADGPGPDFVLIPRSSPYVGRRRLARVPREKPLPRRLPVLAPNTHTGRRPLPNHPWQRAYDPARLHAKRAHVTTDQG